MHGVCVNLPHNTYVHPTTTPIYILDRVHSFTNLRTLLCTLTVQNSQTVSGKSQCIKNNIWMAHMRLDCVPMWNQRNANSEQRWWLARNDTVPRDSPALSLINNTVVCLWLSLFSSVPAERAQSKQPSSYLISSYVLCYCLSLSSSATSVF